MRNKHWILSLALAQACVWAWEVNAQPGSAEAPDTSATMKKYMAYDKDQDGALVKEELPGQVHSLITRADTNGDGRATKEELDAMAKKEMTAIQSSGRGFLFGGGGRSGGVRPGGRRPGVGGQGGPGRQGPGGPGGFDLVERIMGNDSNKDGKVTVDELPEFMQQMMDRIDTNKDGGIDREEAKAMAERFQRSGGGQPGGRQNRPERPARPGFEE